METKIKILRDNGAYFIPSNSPLIKSTYNKRMLVNDIETPMTFCQIPLPVCIEITEKKREIKQYGSRDSGHVLSPSNYLALKEKYANQKDEDGDWLSLKDKHTYELFIEEYTPEYIETEYTDRYTEFEIIDTVVSQYKSINPVNSIVMSCDELQFIYTPNKYEIIQEALKQCPKYKFTGEESKANYTVGISSHSEFDYFKINKIYIDKFYSQKLKSLYASRGTYAQCVEKFKQHVNTLVEIIQYYDGLLSDEKLTAEDKAYVKTTLDNILSNVRRLNINKKDYHSQSYIINQIQSLLSAL